MIDLITKLSSAIYAKLRREYASKHAALLSKTAGVIPGIPDGTGPYGRGMGPGRGQGCNEAGSPAGIGFGPGMLDGSGPAAQRGVCPLASPPAGALSMAPGVSFGTEDTPGIDSLVMMNKGLGDTVVPSIVLQISDNYPNVDPNLITKLVEDIWAYGHAMRDDNDGRVVSIGFDGTIAHWTEFPEIGQPMPGAVESIKKLIDEGWKIVVLSHRASLPGGREQLAGWMSAQGIAVSAIIPNIYSRWYIDDRSLEFNNNWDDIYSKLHYDVPVSVRGPVMKGSDLVEGNCTLKSVANYLGYRYADFYADVKSCYGSHTKAQALVLESKLKTKYGLSVSLPDMAAADDGTQYILGKIAALVDKVASNKVEEGDPVLITEAGAYLGETGIVTNVTESDVKLAIDGDPSNVVELPNKADSCMLLSGSARYGSLITGGGSAIVLAANKHYPEGLTVDSALDWYRLVLPHMVAKSSGLKNIATYSLPGGFTLTKEVDISGVVNPNRLQAITSRIPEKSTYAAVQVRPTANVSNDFVKYVVDDVTNAFIHSAAITDANIRYGGDGSYFILFKYEDTAKRAAILHDVASRINAYIADTGLTNIVNSVTAEPAHVMVLGSITELPAPYSLNRITGAVCLPLDLGKLVNFDPASATVHGLMGDSNGSRAST